MEKLRPTINYNNLLRERANIQNKMLDLVMFYILCLFTGFEVVIKLLSIKLFHCKEILIYFSEECI